MKLAVTIFSLLLLLSCTEDTTKVTPALIDSVQVELPDINPADQLQVQTDSFLNQDALLPNPNGWVNDFDFLFSEEERNSINEIVEPHFKETGNRIYIVTIHNAEPFQSVEQYTVALGNSWNTSIDTTVNTVLIVLCEPLAEVRVESTDAYDSDYSDEVSSNVIFGTMMPSFANEDFIGGLRSGVLETIAYFDLLQAARKEGQ